MFINNLVYYSFLGTARAIKPASICSDIDNNNFQSALVIAAQKIVKYSTEFVRTTFTQTVLVYPGCEVFITKVKLFSALSAIKRVFFNYVTQELIIL